MNIRVCSVLPYPGISLLVFFPKISPNVNHILTLNSDTFASCMNALFHSIPQTDFPFLCTEYINLIPTHFYGDRFLLHFFLHV